MQNRNRSQGSGCMKTWGKSNLLVFSLLAALPKGPLRPDFFLKIQASLNISSQLEGNFVGLPWQGTTETRMKMRPSQFLLLVSLYQRSSLHGPQAAASTSPGTCQKCTSVAPTPDPVNQKFWV